MPKIVKPLTDTQIKNSKPKDKMYKLADGYGLYMIVEKDGRKWWRFDYSFMGKRSSMSLGKYPQISQKEAREKREKYRKMILEGINPSTATKAKYLFKDIALEYLNLQVPKRMNKETKTGYVRKLELHLFPFIGEKDINAISRLISYLS
ncbi:Arm DNA-binding domain-containing protein [Nitrosophilus labii]|uniref:Arm DNA-binding domain-containing protein n=1 Tax=Nitrosophilus labii TaxID=2706014 RepID=UPI001656F0FB|nr:Arm DNA-binding domain-containing protein [Nitrosophilus labii]